MAATSWPSRSTHPYVLTGQGSPGPALDPIGSFGSVAAARLPGLSYRRPERVSEAEDREGADEGEEVEDDEGGAASSASASSRWVMHA